MRDGFGQVLSRAVIVQSHKSVGLMMITAATDDEDNDYDDGDADISFYC